MLERDESTRRTGLSSDIQRALGQRLRQHYAIEQSVLPARLADLLKEFEERRATSLRQLPEGRYVSAA